MRVQESVERLNKYLAEGLESMTVAQVIHHIQELTQVRAILDVSGVGRQGRRKMEVEQDERPRRMKIREVQKCDVCQEHFDPDDMMIVKCPMGHSYCINDFKGMRQATMEIEGGVRVKCQIDQCFAQFQPGR